MKQHKGRMNRTLQLTMASAIFAGLGLKPKAIKAVLKKQGIEPTPERVYEVAQHIVEQAKGFAQEVLQRECWEEWLAEDES